jgi:uncharacterized membrane protein YidH (DUF202 family)
MMPGKQAVTGALLIGVGFWLALLTLAIYMKYKRQRKNEPRPSLPLVGFLALSAIVLVGAAVVYSKAQGDVSSSPYGGGDIM